MNAEIGTDAQLGEAVKILRSTLCQYGEQLDTTKAAVVHSIEGSITLLRMARRELRRR
ncbi:hypothetical protein [Caudoviricetes sp.]|nr:hypothetical protein [Caudoviricetes sp.]UOF79675.1 hypothetical protein [Caudoviricetes sp.]UOF79851.1 hypothetical protein [Bacteriophage sp.]UOF81346.1 hypothetical protein [Caudoviricetes sp.]